MDFSKCIFRFRFGTKHVHVFLFPRCFPVSNYTWSAKKCTFGPWCLEHLCLCSPHVLHCIRIQLYPVVSLSWHYSILAESIMFLLKLNFRWRTSWFYYSLLAVSLLLLLLSSHGHINDNMALVLSSPITYCWLPEPTPAGCLVFKCRIENTRTNHRTREHLAVIMMMARKYVRKHPLFEWSETTLTT